jgi:hypothetical protein
VRGGLDNLQCCNSILLRSNKSSVRQELIWSSSPAEEWAASRGKGCP